MMASKTPRALRATRRALSSAAPARASDLDVYTHGHAKAVVDSHAKRTAEEYAEHTLPFLLESEKPIRLLDVGCGPGSITSGFLKYLPKGSHVVAMDLSKEVLDQAQKALEAAHNPNDVSFQVREQSIYHLQANEKFNVVHAHQVLQHLVDPIDALRKMLRASSDVVSVRDVSYETMSWSPPSKGLDKWLDVYQKVCVANDAQPNAGRHLKTWFSEADDLKEFNKSTQVFGNVVMRDSLETCREWATSWADRTEKTKFGKDAVSLGIVSRDELKEIASAWRDWGAANPATFFYVDVSVVARRESRRDRA